jgi:hypothetical protein
LLPFRDQSWAVLAKDGRYVAAPGEALEMRLEDPESRKVSNLGQTLSGAAIASMAAVRLPGGAARVRATVFSYSGPPRVQLDGLWDVGAVTPSVGNMAAYDVEFLLADTDGSGHRIVVIPPEGDKVARDFTMPQAPKGGRGAAVAVSIGAKAPSWTSPALMVAVESISLGGGGKRLNANVGITGAVEVVRIAVQAAGTPRPALEAYHRVPNGKRPKVEVRVPLPEEMAAGKYEVRVQGCSQATGCRVQEEVRFEVEVR